MVEVYGVGQNTDSCSCAHCILHSLLGNSSAVLDKRQSYLLSHILIEMAIILLCKLLNSRVN